MVAALLALACAPDRVAPPLPAAAPIPAGPDPRVDAGDVPPSAARHAARPLSGGGLADVGGRVIVADADADRLLAVDPSARVVTGTLELAPGDWPGRMAEDDDGRGYVVLRGSGELLAFSPEPLAESWRTAVCAAPTGVAWDPDGGVIRVACASGLLATVDRDGSVLTRVRIVPDLRDVVVEEGRIWVSTFRRADVLRVDADGTVLDTLRAPDTDFSGAPGPSTASVAWDLVPNPAGGVALLHQWRRLSTLTPSRGDTAAPQLYYGDDCATIVLAGVTVFEPDGDVRSRAAIRGAPLAVDLEWGNAGRNGGDPAEVDWWLASAGVEVTTVQHLPTYTEDAPRCGGLYGHPGPAHTVALLRDDAATWWELGRQPLALTANGDDVPLPGSDHEPHAGSALFHRDSGVGLACASCHPEGGDDGQVWSFDVGERRTQSLRAALSATAPYHWDGAFGTFGALMEDVLVERMSGEPATDADSAALLDWLDGLPVPRAAEPPDPDLAARGAVVFEDAGCASCHAGPAFTDDLAHDVGTGGTFQTPSLLGVSARAPYLHDGCAEDLRARFGPCGGDRHGAFVPDADLDALVAYLETL